MHSRWPVCCLILLFLLGMAGLRGQNPVSEIKTLLESYEFSRADSLAELYLSADSNRTDLLLLKGRAQAALFRYPEAIETYRRALQTDSTNLMVLNELTDVYRLAGSLEKATATSRKICTMAPDNRYYRLRLANMLMADEHYSQAESVLLPLFAEDSGSFYVAKQLGNCYLELGQTGQAIRYYRQALRIVPFDPFVTGKLINSFIRLNEISMALYRAEIFLAQHPDYLPILRQSGYCNYLLIDFTSAERRFRECIHLGDSSKFSLKYLGLTYYKQERYDSATPLFRAAFLTDTTDAEVCFYYGVSATRSFETDTGLVYLERSLRLLMPPGQFLSSLYAELAAAYTATGKADTAIVILEKALGANPSNNTLRFKIAYQFDYHLREPYKALPWYREFLKYDDGEEKDDSGNPQEVPMTSYVKKRIPQITGK